MTRELKYEPMSPAKMKTVLAAHEGEQIIDYIHELWELIAYQQDIIKEQRVEIISIKHKTAWRRYDKE